MSQYIEDLNLKDFCDIYDKLLRVSDKSKGLLLNGYKWVKDIYNFDNDISEINTIFNDYALNMSSLCSIYLDKVICYNPMIVKSFMYGKSITDTHTDKSRLIVGLTTDEKKLADSYRFDFYKVLDKFCPNIISNKFWSSPIGISYPLMDTLSDIFDTSFLGRVCHIYMKNNIPCADFLFRFNSDLYEDVVFKLVSSIINNFGHNIKEVFISFNSSDTSYNRNILLCNEVIVRRNSDGELTLTIY